MRNHAGLERVVWAINPFGEEHSVETKEAAVLRALLEGTTAIVEPVYVLSPELLTLPLVRSEELPYETPADKAAVLGDWVDSTVSGWLTKQQLPGLQPPRRLLQAEFSTKATVETLLNHAREINADVIAVGTQAREGLGRFLLGSFAETLLLQSEIPVLIVSPNTRPAARFDTLFCPTDFSPAARQVYLQALRLASRLGAEVTLFHKVIARPPYLDTFFPSPLQLIHPTEDATRGMKTAGDWAALGEAAGVRVVVIVEDSPGPVDEAVIRQANERPDCLVMMASETGTPASALIGAVTRQVVRHVTVPVWVIHPDKA